MSDYVDIGGIAAILRRSPKTVRDKLVHKPDFPPPAIVSGPRSRHWLRDETWAKVEQARQHRRDAFAAAQ